MTAMRSPFRQRVTSGPTDSTSPAISAPGIIGSDVLSLELLRSIAIAAKSPQIMQPSLDAATRIGDAPAPPSRRRRYRYVLASPIPQLMVAPDAHPESD